MVFRKKKFEGLSKGDGMSLSDAAESAGRLLLDSELQDAELTRLLIEEIDKKYVDYLSDPRPIVQKIHGVKVLKTAVIRALNKEPENFKEFKDIAINGVFKGHPIPEVLGKYITGDEEIKIAQFIKIYLADPGLAELIAKANVIGFHGTRSGALSGILKEGALLSAKEARSSGVALSTGERTFSPSDGQPTISFSDWREPTSIIEYSGRKASAKTLEELEQQLVNLGNDLEFAKNSLAGKYYKNILNSYNDLAGKIAYIRSNPNTIETQLMLEDFPIAFGLSGSEKDTHFETIYDVTDSDEDCIIERATSDIPGEFLVKTKRIPLDRIPVIATTEPHKRQLRQILDRYGYESIIVMNLESLNV